MRIAVTYENMQVFQHFGHIREFKLYDVNEGKVVFKQIVESNGPGHGYLASFFKGGAGRSVDLRRHRNGG